MNGQGRKIEKARWIRDLKRFLPLKSQFVLSGNVRDYHILQLSPDQVVPAPLNRVLDTELRAAGYANLLIYNLKDGFSSLSMEQAQRRSEEELMREIGLQPSAGRAPAGLQLLKETLGQFTSHRGVPSALIIDFASCLSVRKDNLSDEEHRLFTEAFICSLIATAQPTGEQGLPFFNTVLWIVEKENDLPDWLVIGNPKIRTIPISAPDRLARTAIAPALLGRMPGANTLTKEELEVIWKSFVDETEGLLLIDMMAVCDLGRAENITVANIADAVRHYKVGVTEDPWSKIDRDKIRDAERIIKGRVKGQDHAITHILDIIKRAVTGVGFGKSRNKPRGVAFLAGPTGVGKTELAKTVTELLFGDEEAYIRFDMSEFSAEHADQRLIGAPPGYLGHDAGGELTNAIRERPFSVVLFDEIEKAHPRILDKFLQILDDGVLTSGRGDRVYFSEALILFTSNLGINRQGERGDLVANVNETDSLQQLQAKVETEIDRYFKMELNRPEILNRLGENIIIFDWIRPEIAKDILSNMITDVIRDMEKRGFGLSLSEAAMEELSELCLADLSNGGRGIRNQVEAHLINPLARSFFDMDAHTGSNFVISSVKPGQGVTQLTLNLIGK